ncbi:MAG: hypothetical protein AB7R90_10215 [Reyranellaceae bacterium]
MSVTPDMGARMTGSAMPTGPIAMLFSCAVFMMPKTCSFMTDFSLTCKANVALHPNGGLAGRLH